MARVKSGFRKRFNIRYLRWMLARATIGRIPALQRRYSFYPQAILPEAAATTVLEDARIDLPTLFSAEETDFVRDRCWLYDTLAGTWEGGPTVRIARFSGLIRDAVLLGHVSRIFVPERHAVVVALAQKGQANWNFAKPGKLRPAPSIGGRSFFLMRTDNYYHALFHDLVPIVDYLDRLHPRGMPLTLVVPKSRLATLALGCELIARRFPGVHVAELADDAVAPAAEALWLSFDGGNAEWTFADPAPVRHLAEIFRDHYAVPPGSGRRLFFSRGGSKIRRLLNEEALWEIAREHGFERFEAHAGNHAEQVRNFSQADIVVGVHGAGLGNLAFCRPGTKMIEIFPENFTKSTYLWLSKRLGLDYAFLVGGPGDYDQAFMLDENLFRSALAGALREPI
ncbi:glycosyltransferase family 61 protein [Labrys monachus]|uniref:Glycosyltransferase 61 catalytic domain-containing protein n=1 Tax=Labrys monachus TaxID=217067 RepID=A0ABU0FEQ9_9HYPH|nr:glycosyltransferase family 61 protein [Labrys monachus]MDQ0393102.1 hypothetical protein [Labrys monachus]